MNLRQSTLHFNEGASALNRKIVVAHLIHTMAYGGIETAILNWLKTMDPSRFQIHLFCFANPGATETPFVEAANRAGFVVHKLPWNRWKPVFKAARVMADHVKRLSIDVLHCHNTYAQLVTILVGRKTGVKTVTTIYVWGEFGWKRAVLQWVDQYSLRFLDQVSAHCEETFRETVRRGIRQNRLKLLICGFSEPVVRLSMAERKEARASLGASCDDFVFINVARFWPEKAHDVLLEGFRLIHEQRPNTKLWICGVGPLEQQVRALSCRLGLDDAVNFLGFRKDLPRVLALADMQLHPSDMEGVPLAVCSGMAAELPIVASSVGGLVEILRDGESAMLIAPRDPAGLAHVALELIEDEEKRKRLGAAARRFIEEEYSLAVATARVENLYEEVVAR